MGKTTKLPVFFTLRNGGDKVLSWKKMLPLIILMVVLFVNLAISIARFNSYTTFMGDFKANLYATNITESSSEANITFKIAGQSGMMAKNAYFSEASCLLMINGHSLGVYQFPTEGILGQFNGKSLVATATFNFSGDYYKEISKFPSTPLKYTLYIVTHFLTGNHDTRGTLVFEGTIKEAK